MSLKTLIVDDEPIARRILREELESMDDVEVVGEAEDGGSALEKIARHKPDLVLLDLQMPVMGGFEVVRQLNRGDHLPAIVIVTAYDKFALQAFEAGAIDYLLKPVGHKRLSTAVERARQLSGREAVARLARLQEVTDAVSGTVSRRIVGRVREEFLLLKSSEIYAFQAEGNIVWIVTANQRYQATQTLKALEEWLANTNFRRIHRNAIVNMDHVRKIGALSSQRWLITLANDQELRASRRQARSLRELLHG